MNKTILQRQHTVNIVVRTTAGDTFSALVVQLLQLSGLLLLTGDKLAKPAGQTSARWQVLAAAEEDEKTVAQVARVLELTRQSVQRVANVLVAEGLAQYEANPRDKRADLLRLTPAGRAALEQIQLLQRVWANTLAKEIGQADLEQARELITRITKAVAGSDVMNENIPSATAENL